METVQVNLAINNRSTTGRKRKAPQSRDSHLAINNRSATGQKRKAQSTVSHLTINNRAETGPKRKASQSTDSQIKSKSKIRDILTFLLNFSQFS